LTSHSLDLIPLSDVSPWNLLHDGSVSGVERDGDRVSIDVDIEYLRQRFEEPGTLLRVELLGCTLFEFTPGGGAAALAFEDLAKADLTILSAVLEGDDVVVWCGSGALRLRYRELALRFESGKPLSLAALDECARQYWDDFGSEDE
jgi:hypothetical protein